MHSDPALQCSPITYETSVKQLTFGSLVIILHRHILSTRIISDRRLFLMENRCQGYGRVTTFCTRCRQRLYCIYVQHNLRWYSLLLIAQFVTNRVPDKCKYFVKNNPGQTRVIEVKLQEFNSTTRNSKIREGIQQYGEEPTRDLCQNFTNNCWSFYFYFLRKIVN